jgi:CheY-like chemotaxis protein
MIPSENASPYAAILVVDDEPLARMELSELVHRCGYQAWEAANTAEALSMLDQSAAHFVGLVTDINMPGTRSGLVLANHIHCIWPHISIVVISAARSPMNGELPEHASFIPKPITPNKLASALAAPH